VTWGTRIIVHRDTRKELLACAHTCGQNPGDSEVDLCPRDCLEGCWHATHHVSVSGTQ
jgi:hypothetical protein